ncbi:hypothetical protein FACS1894142_5170 [Spirochaetia bacterium]|nr:hypothetical protein FACS1894142_5170 [Spirochaetia bacterium]
MPWRLIGFILLCGIFVGFIGANLENKSDISFVFTTLHDVPVYLTIFSGFLLGLLCTIPFVLAIRSKRAKSASGDPAMTAEKPKKVRGKKDGAKLPPHAEEADEPYSDKKTYGID